MHKHVYRHNHKQGDVIMGYASDHGGFNTKKRHEFCNNNMKRPLHLFMKSLKNKIHAYFCKKKHSHT